MSALDDILNGMAEAEGVRGVKSLVREGRRELHELRNPSLLAPGEQPDANDIGGFRAGDPSTSRKGAIDQYPRSGSQRHRILLSIIRGNNGTGLTYEEVETHTGIKGAWKRLSELKQGDWIVVDREKKVSTGSEASVYVATEKALEWARKEAAGN